VSLAPDDESLPFVLSLRRCGLADHGSDWRPCVVLYSLLISTRRRSSAEHRGLGPFPLLVWIGSSLKPGETLLAMRRLQLRLLCLLAATSAVEAGQHTIEVARDGLVFDPETLSANPGDVLTYTFYSGVRLNLPRMHHY